MEAVTEQRDSNGTANGKMLGGITGKGFMPGKSGNPTGAKPGRSLTARLRAVLEQDHNGKTVGQALIDVVTREALKGDFRFAKEILDRIDGPITQKVEGEMNVGLTYRATFDEYTPPTPCPLPEATNGDMVH
jgi:hypothetical protein